MIEKDLKTSVQNRLSIYELTGEVVWWERLNSLKVKTIMGTWVQGCRKGTPDIIALIRNRESGITALFLELKSSTGKLRPEQVEFYDKYNKKKDVVVLTINAPFQLDHWIDKYAKDFICHLKI